MSPASTTVTKTTARRKGAGTDGKAANGRGEINGTTSTGGEPDDLEQKYKDFFWTYTEEPHRTRRLAIIKAHPEVLHPDRVSSMRLTRL